MGGTGSGQKVGTAVSWGDGQNFHCLGDPPSPQEKKTLQLYYDQYQIGRHCEAFLICRYCTGAFVVKSARHTFYMHYTWTAIRYAHVTQHIKMGTLQAKSFLSSKFDVSELFLSFKMTPHLSKLIKAFKFYNHKTMPKFVLFC